MRPETLIMRGRIVRHQDTPGVKHARSIRAFTGRETLADADQPAASIDEIAESNRVLGWKVFRRRVVDLRRTLTYNPPLTMAKHSSSSFDLARSAATVRWNELQSERSDLLKASRNLRNVRARTSATVSKNVARPRHFDAGVTRTIDAKDVACARRPSVCE